jgi:hypothetical protein
MDDEDAFVIPSALIVVIGLWLTLSPLVLTYAETDPRVRPIAGGALLAALAALHAVRVDRGNTLSWANAGLGVWLLATALIADATPMVAVNLAICGGLVIVLAVLSVFDARA